MKNLFGNFQNRMMKAALAAVACAFLLFAAASPAVAFGNSSSAPSEGVSSMNDLQETSKQAVKGDPDGLNKVQRKAKRGLNEVQGAANAEKMNTPADSKQATTVTEQVEDVLENITPGS